MTALRGTRRVTYPFGNYSWEEVAPHEYHITKDGVTPIYLGRIIEQPPHGRTKGSFILPDYNQEYAESQLAVMGLELAHTRQKEFNDRLVTMGLVANQPPPKPAPVVVQSDLVMLTTQGTPPPPVAPTPVADWVEANRTLNLIPTTEDIREEPVPDNWITVQEMADRLDLPDSTVHSRIREGVMKARKIHPPGYAYGLWRVAPPEEQDPKALLPNQRKGKHAEPYVYPEPEPEPEPEPVVEEAPEPEPEPVVEPEPEPVVEPVWKPEYVLAKAPKGWIDSKAFAEAVGISTDSVRRMAQRGSIYAKKVKRGERDVWMMPPTEVEVYLASHHEETQPEPEPEPQLDAGEFVTELTARETERVLLDLAHKQADDWLALNALIQRVAELERQVTALQGMGKVVADQGIDLEYLVRRVTNLENQMPKPLPVQEHKSWVQRMLGN